MNGKQMIDNNVYNIVYIITMYEKVSFIDSFLYEEYISKSYERPSKYFLSYYTRKIVFLFNRFTSFLDVKWQERDSSSLFLTFSRIFQIQIVSRELWLHGYVVFIVSVASRRISWRQWWWISLIAFILDLLIF
jgi:hypothetical protein